MKPIHTLLTVLFTSLAALPGARADLVRVDSQDKIVRIAATATSAIYGLGTDGKLYLTTDAGAHWSLYGEHADRILDLDASLAGELILLTRRPVTEYGSTADKTTISIGTDGKSWKDVGTAYGISTAFYAPSGEAYYGWSDSRHGGSYVRIGVDDQQIRTYAPQASASSTGLFCGVIQRENWSVLGVVPAAQSQIGKIGCWNAPQGIRPEEPSAVYSGSFLKATVAVDGRTVYGLDAAGRISALKVDSETHETLLESDAIDLDAGIYGKVYALVSSRPASSVARTLLFQRQAKAKDGTPLDITFEIHEFGPEATVVHGFPLRNSRHGFNGGWCTSKREAAGSILVQCKNNPTEIRLTPVNARTYRYEFLSDYSVQHPIGELYL